MATTEPKRVAKGERWHVPFELTTLIDGEKVEGASGQFALDTFAEHLRNRIDTSRFTGIWPIIYNHSAVLELTTKVREGFNGHDDANTIVVKNDQGDGYFYINWNFELKSLKGSRVCRINRASGNQYFCIDDAQLWTREGSTIAREVDSYTGEELDQFLTIENAKEFEGANIWDSKNGRATVTENVVKRIIHENWNNVLEHIALTLYQRHRTNTRYYRSNEIKAVKFDELKDLDWIAKIKAPHVPDQYVDLGVRRVDGGGFETDQGVRFEADKHAVYYVVKDEC